MITYDIAFDLDDVIFDTYVQIVNRLKFDGKIPQNFEMEDCCVSNIEQIFGPDYIPHSYLVNEVFTNEFFYNLPPYQEIIDDIKDLIQKGARVCYITSRDISQYGSSVKALEKVGISDPKVYICATSSKAKLAKQFNVKIFVDDRSEVAFSCMECGISAYVPVKPYNSYINKFGVTVGPWNTLKEKLFQEAQDLGIIDKTKQKQEKVDGKWYV